MALNTIIEIKNAAIYQGNHMVLNNVNLEVEKGQLVYLVGKVGSGKSSLIKVLTAEIGIKEGEGSICGFDLRKIRNKEIPMLRRKLGVVFQDLQLLNDRSVRENLEFVLKSTGWKNKFEIDKRINDVLEKVKMELKDYKFPFQLSGGEQQRIAIARALLNNPEVLLADEPTGNLDPETSEDIMKLLLEISITGCTVIVATHNYNLIKKFPSRIIRFTEEAMVEVNPNTSIDL
ncbi:cell division ATP-binding protein FtsE [Acetobacteroides hydrogenigenes]|uniref:Cell division ATP-binding protein FtsE n=1 Tax=Acetobacteroides hydrogenigenes TaxID=979970 RepID=A0A4R2F0P0_9BACT|nr:ATP-binding cassette domain-containing protein [Acetobacteroides hydrogenigenes]TCN72875.1 cell division transport system ATP-binding protein [Acetobacteroides hydrogenigenes]